MSHYFSNTYLVIADQTPEQTLAIQQHKDIQAIQQQLKTWYRSKQYNNWRHGTDTKQYNNWRHGTDTKQYNNNNKTKLQNGYPSAWINRQNNYYIMACVYNRIWFCEDMISCHPDLFRKFLLLPSTKIKRDILYRQSLDSRTA